MVKSSDKPKPLVGEIMFGVSWFWQIFSQPHRAAKNRQFAQTDCNRFYWFFPSSENRKGAVPPCDTAPFSWETKDQTNSSDSGISTPTAGSLSTSEWMKVVYARGDEKTYTVRKCGSTNQ